MEINRRPLEPIHGILARHAAQRNEHPRRVIQRLLPETGAVSFSVVLPTHLELLAATLREHAPGGALTAPALAAQHTFFPAISTFLEEDERADLLRRMLAGDRVAPYPICHVARAGGEAQTMRWCPECARVDRASIIPDASWRMPHQIFGVRACAEHGCRLIQAPCGFGEPRSLHEANAVIPEVLPMPVAADPVDVEIARDLAGLFTPDCPRPGRRRIAATLERAARRADFVRGPSRQIAISALLDAFTCHYGAEWLDARGVDRPTNSNLWPRNCMSAQPDVHPAFFIALLGRFLGAPLRELLTAAVGDPPPERALSPITVHFTTPDGQRVAAAKEEFLAARRANPTASRSDLRVVARNACTLLVRADPQWLAENFPQRRRQADGVTQDWTALDGDLAGKVAARAAALRAETSRPDRITATLLRREVDGMRWAAASWRSKLPRFHTALDAEADTDFAYGDRRAKWYHREILALRAPTTNGVDVFLKRAALAYLATKEPRIRDLVRHLVLG